MTPHRWLLALPLLLPVVLPSGAAAQARQTQADDYTRYELQAPGSAAFRILYDVSATTPGATHYFNTIRDGAEETVHGVTDLHGGRPLAWELVEGEEARRTGHPGASATGRYIRVSLARPVPEGGEGRIRIDKTYVDPESYLVEGDDVVFTRSLGIRRNAVVLPAGHELVAVSYPSQVAREEDGRIRVSFMNPGPGSVTYTVRGRKLTAAAAAELARATVPAPADAADVRLPMVPDDAARARLDYAPSERAFQDREIVYFLQQPETHAFRLFHDYTESRPGVGRYVNVVRAGSAVSEPSATNLDTGEPLVVETLRGRVVAERGIFSSDQVSDATEVVVISFDPPAAGASVRLRIWETYTDPGRYLTTGGDLVWDRAFGRPRNAVVLPEGWMLTASAIPAVVSETGDGRIRLDFVNDRPDEIRVYVRGRRRAPVAG